MQLEIYEKRSSVEQLPPKANERKSSSQNINKMRITARVFYKSTKTFF